MPEVPSSIRLPESPIDELLVLPDLARRLGNHTASPLLWGSFATLNCHAPPLDRLSIVNSVLEYVVGLAPIVPARGQLQCLRFREWQRSKDRLEFVAHSVGVLGNRLPIQFRKAVVVIGIGWCRRLGDRNHGNWLVQFDVPAGIGRV